LIATSQKVKEFLRNRESRRRRDTEGKNQWYMEGFNGPPPICPRCLSERGEEKPKKRQGMKQEKADNKKFCRDVIVADDGFSHLYLCRGSGKRSPKDLEKKRQRVPPKNP